MARTGRPPVDPSGPGVLPPTRLGGSRLQRVQEWATEQGIDRSEALRRLIDAGLEQVAEDGG